MTRDDEAPDIDELPKAPETGPDTGDSPRKRLEELLRQAEAGLAEYRKDPARLAQHRTDPRERDRYESRLNFKRDLQALSSRTDVEVAHARGMSYGEIKGIRRVRNMPEISIGELAKLSEESLGRLIDRLLEQENPDG